MNSILIVSHVAPWPATHGNEIRLQRLILWLRSRQHRIVLILTQPHFDPAQLSLIRSKVDRLEVASFRHPLLCFRSRFGRFRDFLRQALPLRLRSSPAGVGAMHDLADQLCPGYVTTLVQRVAEQESIGLGLAYYAFTIKAFAGLPSAIQLLCDTNEVFSMPRYADSGDLIEPFLSFSPDEERAFLQRCDVVMGIQPEESSYLRELLPGRDVVTVGIDYDLPHPFLLPSHFPETIGIIGSDNLANREGLALFLAQSWPLIHSQCPQARLCIAGKLGFALSDQDQSALPPGVTTLGWIPDLNHFYCDLRLVVNPVVRGTGLKIKSVEALAHGRPLVAYPVGLEGISCSSDLPWIEVVDSQSMAVACLALLQDPARCDAMAEAARSYAQQSLGADHVYAPLAPFLSCLLSLPTADNQCASS
jgi:glycosyltransferase involved in cell wall biosynthesis